MKIRDHRGGLAESMATMSEIEATADAVATFIMDKWLWFGEPITAKDVRVMLYTDTPDERIGWDKTYLVLVNGRPFGFCDGPVQ